MTTETIDALTEFKIVEKPKVAGNYRGKYDKLYIALKNLANDRAIELPESILGGKKFKSWRNSMGTASRKRGVPAKFILQNGVIYAFKK